MRKIAAGCALVALLPLAANAATVEELQAQIAALLQQVTALQQAVGSSSAGASVPVAAGQCPLISRTLKQGASGDDVTRLQAFLARDPSVYPEGKVTGYFGALTEAAVKKFQCKNSIVCDGSPESTGYGVVGPRTAAILALQCPAGGGSSGGLNVGGYIRVTPIVGGAPLNVTVETHVNTTKSCTGATYELLYGDNSPIVTIQVPSSACNELVQNLNHTYIAPGVYTITLRAGVHQSTATVTVGGQGIGTPTVSTSDTFSATPTSGAAPLNVSFTGNVNAGGSCTPAAYGMQFGDGQTANIPVSQCSISTYAITHGYNSAGNYTARLYRAGSEIGSAAITVGGGSSQVGSTQGGGTFSASLGYGGDAFSVLATFQLSTTCTAYDVNWGDGTAHATQAAGNCAAGQVTKELSHTYANSGTYTITLKRGMGSGQTTDTAGVSIVY